MFYSDPGNLSPTGLKGVDTNNGPHNKLLVLSAAEQDALLNFPGAAASNTGFAALVVFKADTILGGTVRDLVLASHGNGATSPGSFIMKYEGGVPQVILGGTSVNAGAGAAVVAAGETVVLAVNYNKVTGNMEVWDSENNTSASVTKTAADFSSTQSMFLAGSLNSGQGMDGMIGEVKIFEGVLTAQEFADEQTALVHKWIVGVPLSITSSTSITEADLPYQITTDKDGTNPPIVYNANGLPNGLTLNPTTGEISGTPTETGGFDVNLSATNDLDETATAVLVLTVTDPLPVISSDLAITKTALSPFTYTITATNNPTSFSVIGLGALPTESVDTTNLASTGTFTFTPSVSAVGDSFNLIVTATNDAGTTTELLVVTVLPAVTVAPNFATVTLLSPVPSDSFTADTTSLTVAATVTPAAGETIDTVFVRWNNPPAKPDGTPRAPIILAQLTNTAGDVYEAEVDIGFDPENREIGGGLIDLEVVAYQTNAIGNDDFTSDDVQFRVEPLLAVLFPDDQLVRGLFDIGDIFASARVNTNDFSKVTARISGPGIVFSQEFDTNNPNGVFNFEVPQLINFEGTYSVDVVAEDLAGRTTTIVRELFLTETIESPVAQVVAPSPGFTNEVFTAAIASYTERSRAIVTVQNVGVVGTNVTYGLELISGGQGYYPRNATGATILTTATTAVGQLTRGLGGVTLANGRISALPDTATIFYSADDNGDGIFDDPAPEWGSFGNAVMDDLGDPGANGKIDITAQFFRALGKLKSYKLFVNGDDLTPGNGNLDPDDGLVDIPAIQFPPAGQGSPDPGDYVVVAQVFDENGQVGTSSPVSFQIVPYDPLDIFISRQIPTSGSEEDPVIIGGSATFLAEVSPIDSIDFVEFFESNSGDKLGEGSRVQIDGQSLFRFSYVFPQAGEFKVFARASGFDGQEVISAPVDISVITGDFPEVEITAPSSGSSVPAGANLEILVAATDPDGQITTIEVFNGNEPLGPATPTGIAGQYRLNLTPSVADAGVLNLIARATDDRGNSTDSDVVTLGVVLGAVPQIEILSPAAGTEFFVDQPFEIRARITDADGTIASATLTDIEFFTRVEGVNGTITVIGDSLSFLNDVMSESSTPDEFVFIATINSPDVVGLVITARDDSGNETQSAPLQFTVTNGIVPDVAITAPLAGDSFTRGDIVTIDITSSDVDGSVAQVEVFNGTESLGLANVVSTGNYRLDYAANAVGTVNLSARSTDNLGNVGISNIETISIVSGDLPTVTIDSPSSGTSVTSGKNVEILVTASDPDGQITAVEIYDGALPIGFATPTGNVNEYRFIVPTFNPENPDPDQQRTIGNFNLQARAIDDRNNVGFSEFVTLSVVLGAVPQIEILSPLPGDSFFINQPFVIRARITDADGSITSATFVDREIRREAQIDNNGIIRLVIVEDSRSFTGDDILGPTSTNNVYQFSATLATADLVGLEITATDDDGNVTTSSRVQFTVTNGIAPDVAITAPLTGASYTRGDIVAIDIDASDQDGTISRVEVFNGATLLGRADFVSAGTYRFNYAADAVGNVNLIARATDDLGNVGISNIETITIVSGAVPTVAITLPDGAFYTAGEVITIDVTADDVDGFVKSVEIFNGDVSLGTASKVSATEYRLNLPTSLTDVGLFQLNARAIDDSDNVSITDYITVSVTTGAVPTVVITSPADGTSYTAGDVIPIDVTAGDTDGIVTSVVIYDGATSALLGQAYPTGEAGKYQLNYLTGLSQAGLLNLEAHAIDDSGNVSISSIISVRIVAGAVPLVEITSPVSGFGLLLGDLLELTITATDVDDGIALVEVFDLSVNNGNFSPLGVASATSVPGVYQLYLTPEEAGSYQLQARATDTVGNLNASLPVQVSVTSGEAPTVEITNPVDGADVVRGSLLQINMTADDNDGVVTQVEVYSGNVLLGLAELSGTGSYRYFYSANQPGELALNARATDDRGNVSVSDFVTVTVAEGDVPTVAILSPADEASYTAGEVITIDVTAGDTDGFVTSVVIYDGATQIGTAAKVSATEYRLNLSTSLTDVGLLQLNARATDDSGNVSISELATVSVITGAVPTVAITSPADETSYTAGDVIPIDVTAFDTDGIVTSVAIYDGATSALLGQAYPTGEAGKYQLNYLTGLSQAGLLNLEARAIDDSGNVSISSSISVRIVAGAVPLVEITSPDSGFGLLLGDLLELTITATDVDDGIALVEVFNLSTEPDSFLGVASATSVPGVYQLYLTPEEAGSYQLQARATDTVGNLNASLPVQVSVTSGEAPTVEITNPVDGGADVVRGSLLQINMTADDNDGVVTQVEVYSGNVLLGLAELSGTGSYRYFYSANQPGELALNARATDDRGNVSVSDFVTVTVAEGDVPTVAILSPADEASYTAGEVITIDVTVFDMDGFVTSVVIYDGATQIGTASKVSATEYRLNLSTSLTDVGLLQLNARATDDSGNVSISELATVSVITGAVPTVAITSPADETSYTAGDVIPIDVTAFDTDGIVTSVAIYDGATEIGTASKVSDTEYRLNLSTSLADVGGLYLEARATDDSGNVSISDIVQVTVVELIFAVTFIDPTENPLVLRSTISPIEQVFTVEINAVTAADIQSVQWYFADVLVAESTIVEDTLIYSETLNLAKSGELRVEVTDESGLSVEATMSVIVSINIETPLNSDEAFVRDAYDRLTANEPTDIYVANAVALMDGTVDGQVAYLEELFGSSDIDETEQVLMVYRTMTGEWPDATELAAARAGLLGGTAAAAAGDGRIETGVPQQTFEFFYNAGDIVTVGVTGAGEDPLLDPTLTVNGPSGVVIDSDDDSGLGLNPLVTFIAPETGTYSAIVAAFSIFRGGDFTISSSAINLGGSNNPSLQSLVISLIPEFEARFNMTFPTTTVTPSTAATDLVNQLFKNKHGVNPSAQATVRLKESLTGPGSGSLPGYSGNLSIFTAAFALDNLRSSVNTAYSRVHFYQIPNQPIDDVPLALMIATFLIEDPTDQALAAYAGMTQAQAFESILTDPRYYEQFPPTGVESFVNEKLADLGVFDQSLNGPADDADDDGVSNLMEIALGSDPSDPSDTIVPMATGMEGTEFVITFIRIKASEVPGDFIISLECAVTLTEPIWDTASDTASVASTVDVMQDGVPEGYERVEIRIDTMERDCGFFRLSVDLP